MAIKLPDPGNGIPEQKTGNDEWTNMQIVRDNFSNTEHAASKLIGLHGERIALNKNLYEAQYTQRAELKGNMSADDFGFGHHLAFDTVTETPINRGYFIIHTIAGYGNSKFQLALAHNSASPNRLFLRGVAATGSGTYSDWAEFYSDKNTTKDSNGFIKASSPVLRVFSDKIEGNADGEKMGAKFVKKGVGNYLIKGTTGLADEGWKIELPQDENKNPLVAVEYESLENGDVALRTYKRKFDFETVSIVADHDNPIDIPETRWVDLRFNDLPQEQTDEPAI